MSTSAPPALSAERRARLAARLKGNFAGKANGGHRIPARGVATAPLSFSQARVWFLAQLEPDSSAYHLPLAFTLRGELDNDALERALSHVFERHEALRTSFVVRDGETHQVVSEMTAELPVTDLSSAPPSAAAARVRVRFATEVTTHFDLTRGPLLRTELLRLGPAHHVLLMSIHHIVFDEWSFDVLCRELRDSYAALAAGALPSLPVLPIQYGDFAAWQREQLDSKQLTRQLRYWRTQLDGVPTAIDLPLKGPRPAVISPSGARQPVHVPAALSRRINALARSNGATLFMTLIAAFAVLLERWSGQDDLVIGAPATHRNRVETEPLIGLFLNLLALRCRLSGTPTFIELLAQVRETALGAYSHPDLPFEQLVEELSIAPDLSRAPLVQVMFTLQNTSLSKFELPGIEVERSEFGTRSAVYDLTLFLNECDEGLVGAIEYNPDLFDDAAMARLAGHWTVLLEAIVSQPTLPVRALPCLTGAEQHRQLVSWNQTFDTCDVSTRPGLVARFAEQLATRPSAAAFVSPTEGTLDYAALATRSDQLAAHLAAAGIAKGATVAVCLERSFDAVVALIAIFKAGAAYLPLDPAYPPERLAFMCNDAGAQAVISRGALPAALARSVAAGATTHVDLEADSDRIGACTPVPAHHGDADDIAYIIYTSGSTGQPKGVPVRHRQIINRLEWMWARYPFGPGEMSCQKTALSFVDSLWELLGPLLAGSPTVIVPGDTLRDPRQLIDCLERYQVSRLWLVPSLLRVMLDVTPNLRERLPALDFWVTSGEPLPTTLAHSFIDAMPGAALYNLYGTSEAWDISWYGPVAAGVHDALVNVPIGRAMGNVSTYVLNDALQPQPLGVAGHLYVGGEGLGECYLNAPELSSRTFIDNPFPSPAGAAGRNLRIYRTGDLARLAEDGSLEFLGRSDRQVKLRGFRVEPAEVEALLETDNHVFQAVVLLREDRAGQPLLVAYLRADTEALAAGDLIDRLRALASDSLPAHAHPAAYVLLDAFPHTPSGKLDALALPAPRFDGSAHGSGRADAAARRVAPRTPLEATLAEIYAAVLEVPAVGVHDDFFSLGGHSLLAVRAVADIERATGLPVPLVLLFQARTVARMAAQLAPAETDPEQSSASDVIDRASTSHTCALLRDGATDAPIFIVGTHPRYADLAAQLGPNQRVYRLDAYALEQARLTDGAQTRCSVEAMATHFLDDVRERQPGGPYRIGGGCEGAMIAFEMVRQLQAAGESVSGLAMWTTPTWFRNVGGQWRQRPSVRLARHLRHLLGRGAGVGLSARAWRHLAQHERVEFNLFGAVQRYVPPGPVAGRVALVWPDALGEWVAPMAAHWQQHLREEASVLTVPGHHDTWLDEQADTLGRVVGEFFA